MPSKALSMDELYVGFAELFPPGTPRQNLVSAVMALKSEGVVEIYPGEPDLIKLIK